MLSTRSFATARMPTRSRSASTSARGSALRSRDHERRISAAVRMFSRAVSEPKTSSRWKVRAMPSRARAWALRLVMSRPSSSTSTADGLLQAR